MFSTRVVIFNGNLAANGPGDHDILFAKAGDVVVSVEQTSTRSDYSGKFESVISNDGKIHQTSTDELDNQVMMVVLERLTPG